MEINQEYKEYQKSLPRKRMASGMVIRDKANRVLMVKTSYKPLLEIPGGAVEENESPLEACIREVKEEIGVNITPKRLLYLDYNHSNEQETENLVFLFDGGVFDESRIKHIRVDKKEIIGYAFVELEQLKSKTSIALYNRISQSMAAVQQGETYYIENRSDISEINIPN